MSAVETLRLAVGDILAVAIQVDARMDSRDAAELDEVAAELRALASTLAHVDPAVLDLAAVVAADVAEAPLPDGWTAVVNRPGSVEVVASGGIQWVWVESDGAHWVSDTGGAYAHLADVVAAVTGAGS